jgi:Na+/melibiose symporter-like transporter
LSTLTNDPRERVVLTCFRLAGSKLGVLLVNLTALKMVAWLGTGDDRRGFMLAMPFYAVGSVLLYLFAFRNLREAIPGATGPAPVGASFGALRGNIPWLIIFASSFCFWIAFIARVSTAPYFFDYVLHRKDLVPLANSLDFISLATVFLLPWLCHRTSKRNVWAAGLAGLVLGQLIVALGLRLEHSLALIMTGWSIGFLASGVAMALPFALLSESVDYGEWKTGIRAAGLLTAIGAAFCLKAGSGLGGALPAWIMDASGYVPGAVQSPAALRGIEMGCVWLPAGFFLLSLLPVMFYHRYEKLEARIRADLELRRAAASAPPDSAD